jgi:hypothetical protein
MFRIENEGVIEKSKSREALKSQASKPPGSPKPDTSYYVSGRGELVMATMPSPDLHKRALGWFFTNNRPDWMQGFDLDSVCLSESPENRVLLESISAVGLASMFSSTYITSRLAIL